MKDSCIRNFSFIPSDYDCMITYLNEMLEQGWRLKWVKAGFGGFVRKVPDEQITYVVEPYPNTSILTLRRMPRTWLNFYTGNNWYFVGKSRGNFIYFTDLADPKPPSTTSSMAKNDSKVRVIFAETTRNAIFIAALIFLIYTLLQSKAFMYAYVLTNTYQYLTVILAVLALASFAAILLYSLETVRLQAGTFRTDSAGGLRRGLLYHIRNAAVILLALIFFFMETADRPMVLLYLLLPIAALVLGGSFIIRKMGRLGDTPDRVKKIMPYAYGAGAVTVLLLLFSMTGIQRAGAAADAAEKAASLAKAESMPLLHYDSFFSGECTARSKENNSHLGRNYLYEESSEDRSQIVFSNYTVMNSRYAADKIFDYLYSQAQADYKGFFDEVDPAEFAGAGSGTSDTGAAGNDVFAAYRIAGQNAWLIRRGNTVLLTTVTGDAPEADVEAAVKTLF